MNAKRELEERLYKFIKDNKLHGVNLGLIRTGRIDINVSVSTDEWYSLTVENEREARIFLTGIWAGRKK